MIDFGDAKHKISNDLSNCQLFHCLRISVVEFAFIGCLSLTYVYFLA